MIQVLVVHETPLTGSLMAAALIDDPDIDATDMNVETIEALTQDQLRIYDVVLVSATLPHNSAITLTRQLSTTCPDVRIVVFDLPPHQQTILSYIFAGASGYMLRDVGTKELFESVQAAYKGQAIISPEMASELMECLSTLSQKRKKNPVDLIEAESLTPRECEVLTLVANGSTNQEIAQALYIQVGTVKNHVHNILQKLNVNSREAAATYLPYISATAD